ncbi:MAG: hypothetical protein J6J31_03600 [Thermoguttaceae bacterium]|nr:hypothetical protein [Thermoguttaceae bacterium]
MRNSKISSQIGVLCLNFCSLALFLFCSIAGNAAEFSDPLPELFAEADPYCVVWETPGRGFNDSMPLGNGEVCVNAWTEPDGRLEFFIARTDAWDEFGRLLKVGGVRIAPDLPNPECVKTDFRQELDTRTGTMSVQYGSAGERVKIRVWIDSERPVIVAEIDSEKPLAPTVTQQLWRTETRQVKMNEVSDLPYRETVTYRPDSVVEASVLPESMVGWFHANGSETPAYDRLAKIQGSDDFPRVNPLKDRIFGAVIHADGAKKTDAQTLTFPSGTRHTVEIAVLTLHPATEEKWIAESQKILADARKIPLETRYAQTAQWWRDFQNRSWILLSEVPNSAKAQEAKPQNHPLWTLSAHDLRIGVDSDGKNRFLGQIESVEIFRNKKDGTPEESLFSRMDLSPQSIPGSDSWNVADGWTMRAKLRLKDPTCWQRIFDKLTSGRQNGFLADVTPNGGLRVICGEETIFFDEQLPTDRAFELMLEFDQKGLFKVKVDGQELFFPESTSRVSDAFRITRGYTLQRYLQACAGRGNYAIKFNGSLFTIPAEGRPDYADYRRWGTGYWWQNTRLPYYTMNASGDFDLQKPLWKQYASLLPLMKHRVKKYFGPNAEGAYFAECLYFWGDVFPEAYGTTPWNEKDDPLQNSRWHKWEFVGGLELAFMALDYWEFTQDEQFLRETAIPLADEITKFFGSFYRVDPKTGKLDMTPSQVAETWWDCSDPMTEIAGLYAVLPRLLALEERFTTPEQRAVWKALLARIPPIPAWVDPEGTKRLAPARTFASKHNCETCELYCVFPFRLAAVGKEDAPIPFQLRFGGKKDAKETTSADILAWENEKAQTADHAQLMAYAKNALEKRWDHGAYDWRYDDIIMAYLGETESAKEYLITRSKRTCRDQRFPAYWAPPFSWTPDQCHGAVLMAALQGLIMQTDGEQILLLPAFPSDWNAEFKLHAPKNTVVSGTIKAGKLVEWNVSPESRRKDVRILGGTK